MADKDDLLKALFERTYNNLTMVAKRIFLTLCNWNSMQAQVALEAVLLRPENDKMDVTTGIDDLLKSALIESQKSKMDDQVFLSVPLVTLLFGKKKLVVSSMKSAIEADSEILREFGNAQESGIAHGFSPRIEKLYKYITQKVNNNPDDLAKYLPITSFICSKYPRGWILLAYLYEELSVIDGHLELAIDALRHILEDATSVEEKREAWAKLSEYCRSSSDWLGEVQANVELVQLPGITFQDISDKANRLNLLLKDKLELESDEKRILINKFLDVMEKNMETEGSGTDYSRMAWLALNIQDDERAKMYTEKGLLKDPNDPHILSLAKKLVYINFRRFLISVYGCLLRN